MRFAAILFLSLAGGCQWVFDEEAPGIPLVGDPPSMGSFARVNHAPVRGHSNVQGKDGATWKAILEVPRQLHVVRLSRPKPGLPGADLPDETEETIPDNTQLYSYYYAFYFLTTDPAKQKPTQLKIRSAAETDEQATHITFDPGPAWLSVAGASDMILYWKPDPKTRSFQVMWRSGTPTVKTHKLPDDVRGDQPGNLFWQGDSKRPYVVLRTPKDELLVYDILNDTKPPVSLGKRSRHLTSGWRPRIPGVDERNNVPSLVTWGEDGLRWVPLDGTKETVVEAAPVRNDLFTWRAIRREGKDEYHFFYLVGDELRIAPFDASRPPEVLKKGTIERLYGWTSDGRMIYSRDKSNRYIYGTGDWWLQRGEPLPDGGTTPTMDWDASRDWRIVERGLDLALARDGKRFRWLEHAAQTAGAGDLLSIPMPQPGAPPPSEEPLRLARNTTDFEELPDGRVLAMANRTFLGTHNRMIVIDEKSREARWVATATRRYEHLPGDATGRQLLVDVYTGPDTVDILRVTVPEKPRDPNADGGLDATIK